MERKLYSSIVRIKSRSKQPVGAGVLIDNDHILTCAHVVNQSLELNPEHQERPNSPVNLDFPYSDSQQDFQCEIVHWLPVEPDGSGDIAGLKLLAVPPSGASPAKLVDEQKLSGSDFFVLGFPKGYNKGVLSKGKIYELGKDRAQLETVSEFKTLPGFSGSPVWSVQSKGVVGIVVTADKNLKIKAGFMISMAALRRAWATIRPLTTQVSQSPQLSIGLHYLKNKFFEEAIDALTEALQNDPKNTDAVFYRVLARCAKKPPSLLSYSAVEAIEKDLTYATSVHGNRIEYWILWAIIKHDYYNSGLRAPEPSIDKILATIAQLNNNQNISIPLDTKVSEILNYTAVSSDFFKSFLNFESSKPSNDQTSIPHDNMPKRTLLGSLIYYLTKKWKK